MPGRNWLRTAAVALALSATVLPSSAALALPAVSQAPAAPQSPASVPTTSAPTPSAGLILAEHSKPLAGTPDRTGEVAELLADFAKLWQAPQPPYDGTGQAGQVFAEGQAILQRNDEIAVQINSALAANQTQVARALTDSPNLPSLSAAHKDAFGPVLGIYFADGIESGKLPLVVRVLESAVQSVDTAKARFQYPRPYVQREKWLPGADTANGANQITGALGVVTREDGTGSDGKKYVTNMAKLAREGSFPSGHSADTFAQSVPLAVMVPELAPEIMARASEYANNRLVLGVHYPLDLIGGRIAGTVFGEALVSAHPRLLAQARKQLRDYLAGRCQADGYGASLAACLENTGAIGVEGYSNSAVDAVATVPVSDRESAVKVFTARMTYGFAQDAAAGAGSAGSDGAGEKLPSGFVRAASLLRFAYPELSAKQRAQVVALTALPAGYPLSGSAAGWDRVNLARALSSQVLLDEKGDVLSVADWPFPAVDYAGGAPVDHSGLWADVRGAVLWAAGVVAVGAVVIVVVVVVRRSRRRH